MELYGMGRNYQVDLLSLSARYGARLLQLGQGTYTTYAQTLGFCRDVLLILIAWFTDYFASSNSFQSFLPQGLGSLWRTNRTHSTSSHFKLMTITKSFSGSFSGLIDYKDLESILSISFLVQGSCSLFIYSSLRNDVVWTGVYDN